MDILANITIPELVIKRTTDGVLSRLSDDISRTTASNKTESILYKILGDAKCDKFVYYDQAVSLFRKRTGNVRQIKTKLAYDGDVSSPPLIYITTGSDNFNMAGIGRIDNDISQDGDKRFNRMTYCRFASTSNIVIVSDQMEEVLLIYHVLRAMLLAAVDTLSLGGIDNCKMGGADVSLDDELVPKNVFMRAMSLSFEYDVRVPSLIIDVNGATDLTINSIPQD